VTTWRWVLLMIMVAVVCAAVVMVFD